MAKTLKLHLIKHKVIDQKDWTQSWKLKYYNTEFKGRVTKCL